MNRFASVVVASIAIAVAGCQSGGGYSRGPVAPRPTGVEGTWVDANRVAMSTLVAGVFESIATDTGEKLSEGSYTHRDARTIDLTINSIIRGTTTNATCLLATTNQLNCTNSAGVQFVLLRQQAVG